MKPQFEIKDKNLINDILSNVEYGTLALCDGDTPYSVPVNFSCMGDIVYFHGSQSGKKAEIISQNPSCSFSEVYQKTINITQVYKIVPIEIRGKIKLGQHLPQERFEMILEHLGSRGSEIDKLTAEEMKKAKNAMAL